MIIGHGVDIVDIASFAAQLAAPGSRFGDVFTARERAESVRRANPDASFAARWAAKEAAVKAWCQACAPAAPPLAPDQLDWSHLGVITDRWGRPQLSITGDLAAALNSLTDRWGPVRWHLSLSHDGPLALASVVMSADTPPGFRVDNT
ncbi:4'-phosphopantetheinyl transferase superfamily protein [Nanchangia anserum]|uniref:Holo-[acyl-carrier-protein] synthase n=1 Tax=Nanchangia anserum TaxID=2692125 RepID=A0A8I0KUC3_9ACTO|nr:holo-ACP synthase [Nanchangia anserum]